MEIAYTIEQVRRLTAVARRAGQSIGLVPTMGALHAGHVSLIETAKKQTDFVVVSIFVNPTQFAPGEDFDKYPKDFKTDTSICTRAGVDVIFAPDAGQMYPMHSATWVTVDKLTEKLCGRFRPSHFRGVTTVCTKLFNIVGPDRAFFGQKDAQQVIVIKRMVSDLNMPLEIVICPTVREKDGLAMSSRNRYLSPDQRQQAVLLYHSLDECRKMIEQGHRSSRAIISAMQEILNTGKDLKAEYISIVDADTLEDIDSVRQKALVALAARIGTTRLIDNILLTVENSRCIAAK